MLSRYNSIDIETALQAARPTAPFPPASDRDEWHRIHQTIGDGVVGRIIAAAERNADTAIPSLPATLWLEFMRTGQREGYQEPRGVRRAMLATLALAECLEAKGRFLDPLLNVIWAICEESSWALPAHQRELTDMTRPHIDLGVAGTAIELAEVDALLGPQLDPLVGKRIRYEVDRRCFVPYLTRHDHWWLYNANQRTVNNWTAVCNAGVVGAAIYLEPDLARLAEMIARAARSLDDYLSTFDADGGSTEGPGYWSYGFGHYTILAHLVEHRTGGRINFWSEEVACKAATFPLHTALTPHAWVNFSDCDRTIRFIPGHLAYLSRRLAQPDLMRLARNQLADALSGPNFERSVTGSLIWSLRNLMWWPSAEPAGDFVPALRDWYPGMMWMIARYDPTDPHALVLAAKGGNNGEMHNQNDVGNIIVHVNDESVIPDVGRGRYTKAYFGPERYQHFVNSSRGHSVPLVNGCEQLPGSEYRAHLLKYRADTMIDLMTIEMKDAYPKEADVASLKRTVALHREPPRGWVEIADDVSFASKPGLCESVLTTFAKVQVEPSAVVLRGEKGALRVSFDPDVVTPSIAVEKDVDLALGRTDVNLVKFAFSKPVQQGSIRLRIEPV